jgi:D-glycero-D-manno-heptose 1,7-bisphosphate phosphatase
MLFLFDIDGTLISSYMDSLDREYDRWKVLPGRRQRLNQLLAEGHQLGVVTNQAGVAFGYVTEDQVHAKLRKVLGSLNLPETTPIAVCFAHPKARSPQYRDPSEVSRRKPSGAMIRELISRYPDDAADGVLYIGDRPEDAEAAANAGVQFVPADTFFSEEFQLPEPRKTNEQS